MPLEADAIADAAVVGAGIAGLSVAYALAREGARVIVLERGRVASAASGRNAGFILAGVAENFVAACRRYGPEIARRVWRVTLTERALIKAIALRHRIECDLAWNGSLHIAGDDGEWDDLRGSADQLAAMGVRVSLDEAQRAAILEDDGEMHPVHFVRGLAEAAESFGVRIHEGTEATHVARDRVSTSSSAVRAGAVVICTNAYSPAVLSDTRIAPVRGQMLATAPTPERIFSRPSYAHRGYRYWRQTRDGRVLVGGWRDTALGVEVGEDATPTDAIQRHLDAFLAERGVRAPVTHRWAGIMGFSHDALPYAGRRDDGIYMSAGFTGHGNAFAVACGEIVASLVRSGSHPDADLFDPERT